LEPCAGNAAFLNGLDKELPNNKYLSYDIEPEDSRIIKADFLTVVPTYNKYTISIGNPPFGYKGNLAASFINKYSEYGDIIIFILPIQFRRYNIQNKIKPNLKLIYSSDNLPKNSFTLMGKQYNVNCLYQIWVNNSSALFNNYNDLRLLKPLPNKHPDFLLYIHNNTTDTLKYFNKDLYQWDFAVYRQGFYNYNERITDPKKLKPHIQYLFIKYIEPISKVIFDMIDFNKLSYANTSILGYSNTDVVSEYVNIKSNII